MNTKQHNLVARAKRLMVSVLLLLIFLAPVLLSLNWVKGVFMERDPRKVYASDKLAEFSRDCSSDDATIAPFDEPLITITFDDGWESVYSEAFEKLERYCIDSTQYILGDHYDERSYLSKDQIHSMQDAGHEIASHTMTHPDLTGLPGGVLTWELSESHKLLSDEFGTVRDFASPLGANNQAVRDKIKQFYRSHRNTVGDPAVVGDEDINTSDNFDFYQINAYTVRKTTTQEDIQRLIDYTIKRKGWLILTYHQVDNSDAHYAVTPEALDDQLQLIKDAGIKSPTMGKVLDAIAARRKQ